MEKSKLVVVNENCLGCYVYDTNRIELLAVSMNCSHKPCDIIYESQCKNIRLASEKDFEDYKVMFNGFKNSNDYIYA